MTCVDLETHRNARHLQLLAEAEVARRGLSIDRQLQLAGQVLDRMPPLCDDARCVIAVDALEFVVDALCNLNRANEAVETAASVRDRLEDYAGAVGRLGRAPRSLQAFRAARMHAHALELSGQPDEAISRLSAMDVRLQSNQLPGDVEVERVMILRGVLSSAKREGTKRAMHHAERARRRGDAIAVAIERRAPATAASYWHRAACEQHSRSSRIADADVAVKLFRRSLPLRPDTPRDRRTRGMAEGEILVLGGAVEEGARLLSRTVDSFRGVLVRHEQSARAQLLERDLLRAV